jgi:hypothetical protein
MVLTSHKTRDPYMGSPKSRVRVSREDEREKESRVPKRGKSSRGRERQGSALPNQKPPLMVAVMSGTGESLEWPW